MERSLPKDPFILLSYVNTQLRDSAASLEDFCQSHDICKEELVDKLASIQYRYNKENHQFIR